MFVILKKSEYERLRYRVKTLTKNLVCTAYTKRSTNLSREQNETTKYCNSFSLPRLHQEHGART